MTEYNSPNIYPDLKNQQFRLNKLREVTDHFIGEFKGRELMSKKLSKYISSFDYFDKSLIVLSVTCGSISIASLATVIGAPVGEASASFSIAFSISTRILKKLLKTTRNKKKRHNKIVMFARSKLNSIESKISKSSINNEISHEDFMPVINEERNNRELKERIRMRESQRSDTKKTNLNEEVKKIGINEIIKRNQFINNSLKP